MPGNAPLQIISQQCVDIELIEVQVYGRWPITTQMNIAVDGQFRMFELRLPLKVQVWPLCHRVNCEVAGALVIEAQVTHPKNGVHGGCLRRARTHGGEVHAAFHGYTAILYLRDSGEIKIRSGQVEVERTAREVVVGVSCDT